MREVIVNAEDLVCLNKEKLQELIRCKDCVHWYNGKNINYCRRFWDDDGEPKLYRCTADDYCSRAERKEHETD